MSDFDWTRFSDAASEALLHAAEELLASVGDETPYGLALTSFYAETTGPIYLPMLALGTEETLDHPEWRWSAPDFEHIDEEWLVDEWPERLVEAVDGLPRTEWETAHQRYEQTMLDAMTRTRTALVTQGKVPSTIVCFLDDFEDGALIRRSLTEEEISEHFPHLLAADTELAKLRELPRDTQAQRLAEIVGLTPNKAPSSIPSETAWPMFLDHETLAVPYAIAALDTTETRWIAARALAMLGVRSPVVLAALRDELGAADDPPGRAWVARAVGLLGAGQGLLAGRDLPPEIVVAGIAAPYRSHDDARSLDPLDYGLLAEALEREELATGIATSLAPGTGVRTLVEADVPGAVSGLDSPHPLVRQHAVMALNDGLSPMGRLDVPDHLRREIRARITHLEQRDPDPVVRRLAGITY